MEALSLLKVQLAIELVHRHLNINHCKVSSQECNRVEIHPGWRQPHGHESARVLELNSGVEP